MKTTLKSSAHFNTLNCHKAALVQEWQNVFDIPAPLGCHPTFLEKAIAWQKQAIKLGGLTSTDRKQLLGNIASKGARINIGDRLVRVWQGETHQVIVLEEGYLYLDQRWKSLSSIAKAITETHWSGPAFFGLRK